MAWYYMSEVQGIKVYGVAQPLKAQTLTAAKREASRKQAFYGTALYITDAEGITGDYFGGQFIDPARAIAIKHGGIWENLSGFYPGCSDTKKETDNSYIANL